MDKDKANGKAQVEKAFLQQWGPGMITGPEHCLNPLLRWQEPRPAPLGHRALLSTTWGSATGLLGCLQQSV